MRLTRLLSLIWDAVVYSHIHWLWSYIIYSHIIHTHISHIDYSMLLHHCDFPLSESSEPFMAQGEVGWTSPCWEGGAKTHCGCLAIDPGSYSFYVWPPVLWILTCDSSWPLCWILWILFSCIAFLCLLALSSPAMKLLLALRLLSSTERKFGRTL